MKKLTFALFAAGCLTAQAQFYPPPGGGGSGLGDMLGANNLSDVASAATSRSNLGATTVGANIFTLTNPGAISFNRINADNSVTARSAANFKTDLSLGNVDNTSDATKFASPIVTGHPTVEGVTSTGASGTGKFLFDTGPIIAAGTASASSWPKLTSGTVLTTPEAGALEYDSGGFYATKNTTSGRGEWVTIHEYLMTANGSASGTATITDFFPANSAFPTVTSGIYEITFDVFFLKTTAGTMTWTVTNTSTYTNIVGEGFGSVLGGLGAYGNAHSFGMVTTTTAAAAFPVTGTLVDAANHHEHIRVLAECNASGNIRLRGTPSAGTFTPLRGSSYTVRRWAAATVGTFAP